MSSTKVYRMNVKVVIPAPKAVDLLAEVKAKKGVADLEEYFTKHFGKVMEVAAKQIVKTTSTTIPFGYKLFASGYAAHNPGSASQNNGPSKENPKEYYYNFGIQGVYNELIVFMENSYVHTMLRFISPYSKKMMYKPHDEKKEPHGDYYIHIGEGPYHYNLPNLKMGERKAGIPYSAVAASASSASASASASAASSKRKGPPPPPPCELEVVSRSLADKMRKAKEADAEYEAAVKKIEELKERLKELSTKKVELKAEADKLKKRLNTLIEKEAEDCESQASDEEEEEE